MTATDNELASPPLQAPLADAEAPSSSSIMDEIEALAALVGQSEELSESPIPAPTASIARSRPVLATPPPNLVPPTPDPTPLREVATAPPEFVDSPPRAVEPLVFDVVPIEPMATFPTEPDAPTPDAPVDATIPIDRLTPGDMLTPLTMQALPVSSQGGSSASPYPSGVLSEVARLALLDAMPVAVFVIDSMATIRYANQRTADMLGLKREEFLGLNVLDFVFTDDLDFAAELFNVGGRYTADTMGPSRIRYVDSNGQSHWTQVWAQAAPEVLGVDGFIVALTSESVRDVLATAVSSVAADDTLDHTLAAIASSARALPFAGTGAVLMTEHPGSDEATRFRMIGDWPIDHNAINALGTPWRRAVDEQVTCDVEDVAASGLAAGARHLLGEAGVASLFVRPIVDVNRGAVGVLVVFRSEAGAASPNQDDHLEDAIRLAGLAFTQQRRRVELETAALRDFLTGVGNRAALNDRLKTDHRSADVLYIDLDRFKAVNDTFGHDVGDQVVAMAAGRIENTIRRDDKVYRTGGDEFVVLCEPGGDDATERIVLAERIIARLHESFAIGDHDVRIGATVGIAAAGDRSLIDTVRAADQALYSAKEQGRAGWAHDGL